jgi:hypothetical protein
MMRNDENVISWVVECIARVAVMKMNEPALHFDASVFFPISHLMTCCLDANAPALHKRGFSALLRKVCFASS